MCGSTLLYYNMKCYRRARDCSHRSEIKIYFIKHYRCIRWVHREHDCKWTIDRNGWNSCVSALCYAITCDFHNNKQVCYSLCKKVKGSKILSTKNHAYYHHLTNYLNNSKHLCDGVRLSPTSQRQEHINYDMTSKTETNPITFSKIWRRAFPTGMCKIKLKVECILLTVQRNDIFTKPAEKSERNDKRLTKNKDE